MRRIVKRQHCQCARIATEGNRSSEAGIQILFRRPIVEEIARQRGQVLVENDTKTSSPHGLCLMSINNGKGKRGPNRLLKNDV